MKLLNIIVGLFFIINISYINGNLIENENVVDIDIVEKKNLVDTEETVLSDSIYQRILIGIKRIETLECLSELQTVIEGIKNGKDWAIAMYDSSVKVPAGIEYGVVYQFGNYDQCMKLNTKGESNIKPKYCLADVVVEGYNVRELGSRKFESNNKTLIHWGICMPESCSSIDIEHFLSSATGYNNITVTSDKCTINEPMRFTNGDIIFGCIISSFVLMVLFSTIYHVYLMYRPISLKGRNRSYLEMIIKSFSVVENLHKMVKESSDDLGLSSINGIKALAMIFIIASHALVFMIGGPIQNAEFYVSQTKQIQNAFLLNSPLLVDSFLLLGGFLFARLILLEMDKRQGKINFGLLYIFRYIRLTPAYLAMITLYMTWMPKLGDGPIWKSRIGLEQERCQESWWTNLLYINNYVGMEKLCMFQSWYLAADTQLFIIAPLVLYPLWRWRKYGAGLLAVATCVAIVIPVLYTAVHDLDPTFIAFQDEVADLSLNEFFVNSYVKTHMRATAYFFGLLTGFLVHLFKEKNYSLSKATAIILWLVSAIVGSVSMFSVTLFYTPGYEFTTLGNSLYAGFHRLGWSFANSWLVFACVTGYSGPFKRILSSQLLVPLSRLTYCAYLTNGFVELYQAGTIRTPKYMSVTNLLGEVLSHVCLTFFAALVLCLMFESPIHGIEKILLRRDAQKQKNKGSQQTPSTSEDSA